MIGIESIKAVSIAVNAILLWIWIRRREIMSAVFEVKAALKDDGVTDEEYMKILEKLENILDKK